MAKKRAARAKAHKRLRLKRKGAETKQFLGRKERLQIKLKEAIKDKESKVNELTKKNNFLKMYVSRELELSQVSARLSNAFFFLDIGKVK